MGLRGPKPGFRDAQREHAGKQSVQGRPRYSRGDGKPFGKMPAEVKRVWDRIIEATRDSGNIREVAYPELEDFCYLYVGLRQLRIDCANAANAKNWEDANKISLMLTRDRETISAIANKYQFPPKLYADAVETAPASTGPTAIDRILAS